MSLAITHPSLHRLPDDLILYIDSFVGDTSRLEETRKGYHTLLKTDHVKNPLLAIIMGKTKIAKNEIAVKNPQIIKCSREELAAFKKKLVELLTWINPQELERITNQAEQRTEVHLIFALVKAILTSAPPINASKYEELSRTEDRLESFLEIFRHPLSLGIVIASLFATTGFSIYVASREKKLSRGSIVGFSCEAFVLAILICAFALERMRTKDNARYQEARTRQNNLSSYQQLATNMALIFIHRHGNSYPEPHVITGVPTRPLVRWFRDSFAAVEKV